VGFHVSKFRAGRSDKGTQRPHLVQHIVLDLLGGKLHLATAEAQQVGVARMCADSHAALDGQAYGSVHYQGVTGVVATGDVSRGDPGHQRLVGADTICPVAFPHIAVEINSLAHSPANDRLSSPERYTAVIVPQPL
jgi:hypothetical protein